MLNEVLHLIQGDLTSTINRTPFPQRHENGNESDIEGFNKEHNLVDVSHTSCFGCKYYDIEMGEEERKANCFPCFEQVMIRKNYTVADDVSQAKL